METSGVTKHIGGRMLEGSGGGLVGTGFFWAVGVFTILMVAVFWACTSRNSLDEFKCVCSFAHLCASMKMLKTAVWQAPRRGCSCITQDYKRVCVAEMSSATSRMDGKGYGIGWSRHISWIYQILLYSDLVLRILGRDQPEVGPDRMAGPRACGPRGPLTAKASERTAPAAPHSLGWTNG